MAIELRAHPGNYDVACDWPDDQSAPYLIWAYDAPPEGSEDQSALGIVLQDASGAYASWNWPAGQGPNGPKVNWYPRVSDEEARVVQLPYPLPDSPSERIKAADAKLSEQKAAAATPAPAPATPAPAPAPALVAAAEVSAASKPVLVEETSQPVQPSQEQEVGMEGEPAEVTGLIGKGK